MKCKNCKADNKSESICDAGIACYVLRCGEYGCALNGKTVDKLLRMKKAATNADRIRAMTDEELAEWIYKVQDEDALRKGNFLPPLSRSWWLDWLRKEGKV